MTYPKPRSMNHDLEEGMSDGKYQKVVYNRGGMVEKELLYATRRDLSDTYYGIHEATEKRLGDTTIDHQSENFVPTKPAVVGD